METGQIKLRIAFCCTVFVQFVFFNPVRLHPQSSDDEAGWMPSLFVPSFLLLAACVILETFSSISSVMLSVHLFHSVPLRLFPGSAVHSARSGNLALFILSTCPYNLSLLHWIFCGEMQIYYARSQKWQKHKKNCGIFLENRQMLQSIIILCKKNHNHNIAIPENLRQILECGPMPNMMAALPNTGGALCESSVIPFLYHAAKFGWRPRC